MSKFIRLRKTNEKGVSLNEERWNTKYIVNYRKWTSQDDKKLSVVFVNHSETPKGRLIVDNTVEEIDNQINK